MTKEIDTRQKRELDEFLAPSAIEEKPSYIRVGNKFARTIFVYSYPRYLNTNWFSPVINFDREFNISIFIHPLESRIVLKDLRDKLGRKQAQEMEESSAGKVRNPALETAINDIEELRDKLQQGTDRFFEVGVYVTIFGASEKELDDAESKIKNFLDAQLIYAKQAIYGMKDGFDSALPINDDKLNEHVSLNTAPVSSMFPFVSYDLTSDKGILYGINTHNNSLVLFDRFNLENANTVVFGKSGGGKSYTVKLEILRSLMTGAEVFVIDPENEYRYLSNAVGGTNVNISIGSDSNINPFDLPEPQDNETKEDVLRSHILSLSGLIRLMLGDITPEESAVIDEALFQTYAIKDITPDSDFKNIEPPIMSDLQSVLEGMTGTESLVVRLKKYTQGTFSGFINKPTNISLENKFVVFSIRDMEEELRPIAMYVVLNYIWTQVRKKIKKRILVVDEAWVLLRYELGGSFLLNIAKRARKYYLGLTTISQDIPDFMDSSFGKPIVSNSSLQILLKQSQSSIDLVQKTFNLTDAEKFYLLESQVGHGLFFAGTNHVGIQIIASYTEDQIITSDPRQIMEIEEAKKEWADEQNKE